MGRRALQPLDGSWDRASERFADHVVLREAALAATIVLYLWLNTARTTLDHGIAKIHDAGVAGVSTNSLHGGPKAVDTAFATWRAGFTRLHTLLGHHPVRLAEIQTVLDLALVPLSFVVWYGICRAIRRRIVAAGDDTVRRPILTVLDLAAWGIIGYTLLGLFDQMAELAILVHGRSIGVLASTLHVTGKVRALLLPLFLVPLVVGLVQIHRDNRADPARAGGHWWRGTTTTYRVLLVAAALHALLSLVSVPGQQMQDALRLWLATPRLAVAGLLFTSVLSTTLAAIALRLGTDAAPRRAVLTRAATVRMLAVGAALTVLGVGARLPALGRQPWGAGVLAAGLLVVLVAALSLPLASRRPDRLAPTETSSVAAVAEPADSVKRLAPAVLALAPLTTLTLVLTRAAMPSIMDSQSSGWLLGYAAIAAALAVFGFCLARAVARWAFDRSTAQSRRRAWIAAEVLLASVIAVVYALVVADPWRWGADLGVSAIVTSFLTALVLVFGTIGYLMESRALPAALDFVGLRRLPVVLSLVAWGLVSHQLAPGGYHDVQTSAEPAPPGSQLTVAEAFDRWAQANVGDAVASTGAPAATRPATPMVFVAAAGGGIKAAVFTAATLDCIFEGRAASAAEHPCATGDSFERLFAASGASGGSVGIASLLAERTLGAPQPGWVADRLGRDLLSPELAWQLMVEVPNAIVDFDPGLDRGEVLSESWRRQYESAGQDPGGAAFYTDRSGAWAGPLAYFSGTNLNDGCRVNISAARSAAHGDDPGVPLPAGGTRRGACKEQRVVDGGVAPDQAGTRDLTDFLCGGNISLATAAFLSARFPMVSPTGTIGCEDHDPLTADTLSIGDGGYRDNSGASSLMDAWGVLEPLVARFNAGHDACIVPIFVEINNGYSGFGGPSTSADVAQLLAPALGATKVFGDLSNGEIEQAAAEFSRPLAPGLRVVEGTSELSTRFYRVTLVDHPGVTAPLGWSLSHAAVHDLVDQLDLRENRETLEALRSLLDPSPASKLICVGAD
jgi:hypothetical protein